MLLFQANPVSSPTSQDKVIISEGRDSDPMVDLVKVLLGHMLLLQANPVSSPTSQDEVIIAT